eukprot:scaffold682_cov355-Prasinococcus_capsulatus_cf.AAC.10
MPLPPQVIHGRFAMLGVTGAVAQENAGAGPWFNAGALCSPEACRCEASPRDPTPRILRWLVRGLVGCFLCARAG